jgi:hypothetical protein
MVRSKFFAFVLGTMLSGIASSAHAEQVYPTTPATSLEERTTAMKINIRLQDKVVTATLMDNATSRDFVSLLPMF